MGNSAAGYMDNQVAAQTIDLFKTLFGPFSKSIELLSRSRHGKAEGEVAEGLGDRPRRRRRGRVTSGPEPGSTMKTTTTRTGGGIWTVAGGAGEAAAVVAAGIVLSKKQISFREKKA